MSPAFTTQTRAVQLPFFSRRKWISFTDIIRFEGVGNYTRCHFHDGTDILVARSLKVLTNRLPDVLLSASTENTCSMHNTSVASRPPFSA